MLLLFSEYENIKQIVIETFEFYDIKSVPISPFEIALKMGIPVIPYSSFSSEEYDKLVKLSEDGFSYYNDGHVKIYYNDKCKYFSRIRYTIMHELGHYILGHINNGEIEEREANFFAKYALAPPPLIHNMRDEITVENIVDTFDVTYTLARYSLQYYYKWLQWGAPKYTGYERKILNIFKEAI